MAPSLPSHQHQFRQPQHQPLQVNADLKFQPKVWLEISGPSEPELGPVELDTIFSRSISLHHVGHDQLHNAGHDQTDSLTKKGSGSLGESWTLNWSNMV